MKSTQKQKRTMWRLLLFARRLCIKYAEFHVYIYIDMRTQHTPYVRIFPRHSRFTVRAPSSHRPIHISHPTRPIL